MGIPSDRRFLRAARRQLGHLFPQLPSQDALHKRRARLAETIEWLIGVFAAQSPGASDDAGAARLDPGRVRPLARDGPPLPAGRRLRLRLLAEPLPLVLGHAAAPGLRPRRHARARPRSSPPTGPNARSRSRCCPQRCTAARRSSATRATPAASSPTAVAELGATIVRPARKDEPATRSAPRADPAADRVGLLDLQRPPHPRTPRRPHPPQPLRPHRHPAARARRLHHASTTNSADPAAQSPTTPPNPVASTI